MTERNCWPFSRLVITAAVLASAGHLVLGWQVRPREILALPGQMLGVLFCLLVCLFGRAFL